MLYAEPEGLLAARLVEAALAAGPAGTLFLARSETRAARLHRAAAALAPDGTAVLLLPGWDCLPYDRVSPTRGIMGRRMAVLAALAAPPEGPRLLIASAEAALQRLPRQAEASLRLERGAPFEPEAIRLALLRLGYGLEEQADEPGEAALHGGVLDLFPAFAPGDPAWRIRHEAGRVESIQRLDILTQRSLEEETEALTIGPASELVLPKGDALIEARPPGLEHALPVWHPELVAPLALLPEARLILDEDCEEALARRRAEIAEAFRTRIALRPPREGEPQLPPPESLYLDEAAWAAALGGRAPEQVLPSQDEPAAPPRFAAQPEPEAAFLAYAEAKLAQGRRLAIAGGIGRGARRLARRAAEELGLEPRLVEDWPALLRTPPGGLALLPAPADLPGFEAEEAVLVPFAAIRPGGGASAQQRSDQGAEALIEASATLAPGDAVIHLDHGLGALRGVEAVDTGEARVDCLRLDYADGSRLVPFDELDRLWRYGATAEGLSLDRLEGGGWEKRRKEAEAEVAKSARQLLALVQAREAARAPVLRPDKARYPRLVARFPFEPTADQAAATGAVLDDLASGRPMERLVCGDVGFGKTEVAIRAIAVAAFAGRQAALLAPTTVLVRQHLETLRRRFEGFGLRIEMLSRLTPPAEAKAVRAGLASGEVQIVVGTQALASKAVRFADLGLLVVDEEQRLGARQKAQLKTLRGREGLHVLTLTATPIPRTLQAALVGLRDLSVIATPPARRQPVRTLRAPLDDALLAQALRREARRGGQSFVVCPRIEDIAPMRARIAGLLPELSLIEAHGDMPAAEMDEAMVRFADGGADVLLSTNIVETGLDVPRANTMLVWRADRFGLSQLHQLRGRVGRGRARGVIYLLTDPATKPAQATIRRLKTLEALDRIGAGFAISARDLDLRGAGELLGEQQAGHMRLVGMELYRHLLDRALARARGEAPPEAWSPAITLGVDAYVPEAHIPEEALQVDIHARLGRALRAGDLAVVEALEDELEDRFGEAPEPLRNLFDLARLSARCRQLGIAKLEVGPEAAAATPSGTVPRREAAAAPPLERRGERLLLRRLGATPADRLANAAALLAALAPGRRRRAA
ncbi:DEAD/DEAH box helicase [Roseicella aerolata]|uniref:Transcription-repair-coupling factor n=1 Tax=Roseicella aerolata TaxID=2883479 RepID=A0A9X1LDN2_9PROT|nr:DEAD/DEAH box helicase [Roseicella aerolata]MCB4825052.1 DEAD/DEAH box helicase [Roseicella aerolata]